MPNGLWVDNRVLPLPGLIVMLGKGDESTTLTSRFHDDERQLTSTKRGTSA